MQPRSWIRTLFNRHVTRTIRKAPHRARPILEALEDRCCPAAPIIVNNLTDTPVSGKIDLRQAIAQAAGTPGDDTIQFDSSLFSTPQTINLTLGELLLNDTSGHVTIEGPGAMLLSVSGGNNNRVFKIDANVTANFSGLTITEGLATGLLTHNGSGGGLYNLGTANLNDCTISGNTAKFQGGGLYNLGTANLINCTITGNATTDFDTDPDIGGGGGIQNGQFYDAGILNLTDCIISTNTGYSGAGLYNRNGTATLTNCTVSKNTAVNLGGGLKINGTTIMKGCTVEGNSAYRGAGLYDEGSDGTTITNCTFFDNTAGDFGGGLAIYAIAVGQAPTLTNCTISGNSAFRSGGLAMNVFNTITLTNTIVAGNTDTSSAAHPPSDIGGFLSSSTSNVTGSNNLIGTGGSGGLSAADNQLNVPVDQVGLAPMGWYGGPTQTIALLPGSKAIHGGTSAGISTDQRGFSLDSPIDVGAFQTVNGWETTPIPLVVNTTSDSDAVSPGELTLRQAVRLANLMDAATTITFDPAIFAAAKTITLTSYELFLSNTGGMVTIQGPGEKLLTISGNNVTRVFQIGTNVMATITDLTITGGVAENGGGLFVDATAELTLQDCTVKDNRASSHSARAGNGGGLDIHGTVTLIDCTVSGNSATGNGGGLNSYGDAGSAGVNMTNCTVSGNSAGVGGGGLLNGGFSTANLTDCTISGNMANDGAGLNNFSHGLAILNNCTLSENKATNYGGGLFNFASGVAILNNCTISGNSAKNAGGGVENSLSSAMLTSTIVAGNTKAPSSPSDIEGFTSVTGSFNMIGTGGAGGLTAAAHNIIGVADPGLCALAFNGGPTQTMALKPGSPAIGNGLAINTKDQRGFPLDTPKPDIGAFQFQSNQFTGLVVGSQTGTVANGTAGSVTFDVAVNFANSGGNNVTFSFAWITTPAGVKVSFTPSSVTGTNTSTRHATLTISTAVATPAGSYAFTVTGTANGGVQHSTSGTFTVSNKVATRLVFTTQPPARLPVGQRFRVVGQFTDDLGNPVKLSGKEVTIEISSGTLNGTRTVKTNTSGQAIFEDLFVTRRWGERGPYRLTISAKGYAKGHSRPIQILGWSSVNPSLLLQNMRPFAFGGFF